MTAPTAMSVADFIKQGYRLAAHQHVANHKLEIGDRVRVLNYAVQSANNGGKTTTDRTGASLVAGCTLTSVSETPYYSSDNVFQGINADGDLMVRAGRQDYPVPYNFVERRTVKQEATRAALKLNDSYTGTILGDATSIAVGCQRFKTEKLRELLTLADTQIAAVAAEAAAQAAKPVVAVTLAPTATYVASVPKAKAAKKVATKAAAKPATAVKKVATKKVATKRVR